MKRALRAAELRDGYFAETIHAFEFLEATLQKKPGSISAHGKKTHTIGCRTFHYVKAGTINHKQSEVSELYGMQRWHFVSAASSALIKVGELTCACTACCGV